MRMPLDASRLPLTLTAGSRFSGKVAAPLMHVFVARRVTKPPAQRSPSPNATPAPPFIAAVPWKNKHVAVAGSPLACSTSVSSATVALPLATSMPPAALTELAQPPPLDVPLPHGHSANVPGQIDVIGPPIAMARITASTSESAWYVDVYDTLKRGELRPPLCFDVSAGASESFAKPSINMRGAASPIV